MEITNKLISTLMDVSIEFANNNIGFCLTGGLAAGIWGTPRATEDIDFIIIMDFNEKERIITLLKKLCHNVISHKEVIKIDFLSLWRNTLIYNDDQVVILDFILTDSVYLKQVIERRAIIEFRGTSIPLVSIEDLLMGTLKNCFFQKINLKKSSFYLCLCPQGDIQIRFFKVPLY